MHEIDGSAGGGGLLRSALALSAVAGEPVRLTGIRGARPEPGLKPQHLAVVDLLTEVTDADTSAYASGTETLTFRPGSAAAGSYRVDVGTAGSVPLLFDAVLPLAAALGDPLTVTATGGTDVPFSPTSAHYRRTKLGLLRSHGLGAAVDLDRPGFYPAGGGRATLRLFPSSLSALELAERGDLEGARVDSLAAEALADAAVADRQADAAVDRLEDAGVPVLERTVRYAPADSPGSAVALTLEYERGRAGFDALGERGKPSEAVAGEAVDAALSFRDSTAAVDRHTADQLLPFLALAGGRLRAPAVTDHVETGRRLLGAFGHGLSVTEEEGSVLVESEGAG
jgi:RNA 3'-terminal phosphate cyclase (ATP)